MTVVLPILIPLVAGIAMLLTPRRVAIHGTISSIAWVLQIVAAVWMWTRIEAVGTLALDVGGWEAPIGITLVADRFSTALLLLSGILGLGAQGCMGLDSPARLTRLGMQPSMQFLGAGVAGSLLAGDLFNLFVWFEVILISSFAALTMQGKRAQFRAGLRYVSLNLAASGVFLIGVGLLYGSVGSLNMADLALRVEGLGTEGTIGAVAGLLTVSFALKCALFPLAFWIPSAYPVAPAPVAVFFSGMLTKVGVYAIARVNSVIFPEMLDGKIGTALLAVSIPTMVIGAFCAVGQSDMRRIFAFHSMSQVGYMIAGVALASSLGLGAALLFMLHHGLVKGALFAVAGATRALRGSANLKEVGGLAKHHVLLAVAFGALGLSLAGLPPFSGFVAKLAVVRAAFEGESLWVAGTMLATGVLTTMSMAKVWAEGFWKPDPEVKVPPSRAPKWAPLPALGLAAISIAFGLAGGPLTKAAVQAGEDLLDREAYIDAVGVRP